MNESVAEQDVVVTKHVMGPGWGIWALAYMQVCAHSEVPPEQIEARANELNPCGTSGRWAIAKSWPGDEPMLDDLSEMANPARCGQDSGRLHYLLSC